MPKKGTLQISKDKQSGMWIVNVSAKLSPTGSRVRKKFRTKKEAESYRTNLAATIESDHLIKFDEQLLKNAHYYDDAFQLYGYEGLADACAAWLEELERRFTSQTLGKLLSHYKETRGSDWSDGYMDTYKWVKKHTKPLENRVINELDAHHWQNWLPEWKRKGNFAARSYNHMRTFLIALYTMPAAVDAFPVNPIKAIPAAKVKNKEVSIISNDEVKALLQKAWEQDRDLVPWFAISVFAGLRPESELGRLTWEDINFEEKWIRVGFGNRTDTKRYVDLEDSLAAWLSHFKDSTGSIQLTNHKNRKKKIVDGLFTWHRDISRHTYGSNLEAKVRAEGGDVKAKILQNMGHSMLTTFEKHYRNARTPKEAKGFWGITPTLLNL